MSRKKLIKIALILFIIGCITGISTYIYVFHKPQRNIAKEKPAYTLEATNLISEFVENETSSYEKFGNQVLQVTGDVVDISITDKSASITLLDEMEGISCSFDSTEAAKSRDLLEKISIGKNVTLKGQCDGYDMIMGVVLTRCIIMN